MTVLHLTSTPSSAPSPAASTGTDLWEQVKEVLTAAELVPVLASTLLLLAALVEIF